MPVSQPFPSLDILQEEYFLVEAWKKTVAFIRAHNWLADTLEIDRASVELPRFLETLARRLSDPDGFETRPLRLVPAPKSHPWTYTDDGKGGRWKPERNDSLGTGPRLRPLAHVDLGDQVAATAILLCLADRVEAQQGNPVGSVDDSAYRRRVLSYGNRLLCDADGHLWGSTALYRSFFEDWRKFLSRPSKVARALSGDGQRAVVVQSDLKNFYDRVRPAVLARKIRKLRSKGDSDDFFALAEKVLNWRWDRLDKASVDDYARQEEIENFNEVALPQGLASAGFFANVVLLDFDSRIRESFSKEIFPGAYLEDAVRYVDDLRIVLRLDPERNATDVKDKTVDWLSSLLEEEQGLLLSEEKTQAEEFDVPSDRPKVRQSDRMRRIQNAVSGGFDVAGGEAILEAIRGLMLTQWRHPQSPLDSKEWPLSPVADVPDGTVARFAAGRFRRIYRWLRPLLEGSESWIEDCEEGEAVEPEAEEAELVAGTRARTQVELDDEAKVFVAELVEAWIKDPSNVRLLRIALDIWPSVSTLKHMLHLLMPYVEGKRDDQEHHIACYCLAEVLRSGTTETGIVKDDEVLPQEIDEYRAELQGVSDRIVERGRKVPWYLRQQAMLFLATCDSMQGRPIGGDRETSHYAALLHFFDDPDSAPSTRDFATYAVLARRSFAPHRATDMLVQHLNRARLTKIAEVDPTFAIELVGHDSRLSELLPEYVRRDLCLIDGLQSSGGSLANQVLKGENPFRDELALLQFASKMLKHLRKGRSYTFAPVDLSVTVLDSGRWGVREGEFKVQLVNRRRSRGSIYSPPSWCPADERWRFQLGYLLRFILTGDIDFTVSVRPTPWREVRGNTYRPAPVPWRLRRYGFYNAHEAFGDRWLPITEWTTKLLLDLLAWPGARHPGRRWIKGGMDATSAEIDNRIRKILKLQGEGRSELLLKEKVDPVGLIGKNRPIRGTVVQAVLPKQCWFTPGNETLSPGQRKHMRRHLTTALEAVCSTLRLRSTHMRSGGGLDLLILPELSVHVDDLPILEMFSIAHRTIILAGLVYHPERVGGGPPFVNSAVWLLPKRTRFQGYRTRVIEQGKEHLAPEEKSSGLNLRPFRNCQWLVHYKWSSSSRDRRIRLTASVCYDATDLALVADLRKRSDVYIIPARNRDVPTFDNMALALHYHMFQMVIVANNGEFGGSNAYLPFRDRVEKVRFHFHGQPQVAIAYLEIDRIREFLDRVKKPQAPKKKKHQYKQPPAGLP